jgi:hypothetical protein
VVSQECPPALSAARTCGPRASHVPFDRALRDAEAKLQELAPNPFGAPEPVLGRHALDEGDDVRRHTWFVWPLRSGLPAPEQSESFPMPSQQRLGLDQEQGMPPLTMEACEQHE